MGCPSPTGAKRCSSLKLVLNPRSQRIRSLRAEVGGFVEAEGQSAVWLECRRDVWLWPLPPPGLLSFITDWPATGVTETTTTVDAGELIDAASRSEQLWEAAAEDPTLGRLP